MSKLFLVGALMLLSNVALCAQFEAKKHNVGTVSFSHESEMKTLAQALWSEPELGFLEDKSTSLMQELLSKRGFSVTQSVAGMPTAFIAEYGNGKPIIALLAEMDALPGMGVAAKTHKEPVMKRGLVQPGHACGHNLFAGGAVGAALNIADFLDNSSATGTVRVYGTPAEEGGSGKVYLARAGKFKDVDVALHWHPSDSSSASPSSSLANKSGKFRFFGEAAHAAAAPEKGRSALDGVEAMNMMVNLMREHVPDGTRIHYVITHGGTAPNIVPDYAEVYYYVRSAKPDVVLSLWERLELAAEGAALGTQTRVESEVTGGVWNVLPNVYLSSLMHDLLTETPQIPLTKDEIEFGKKISSTRNMEFDSSKHGVPQKFSSEVAVWSASTDVGDVSWQIPTVGLSAATWVKGTPPHTWQASSMSGMEIGHKGMYQAAEVLTKTAISLLKEPVHLKNAKNEFKTRSSTANYIPMIGQRAPALDYRK